MKYEPAGHRLLIKRDEILTQTASGLYIASDEKLERASMNRGTVLSVGKTCWQAAWLGGGQLPWCKEGDRIMFAKYGGVTYIDEETKEEFLLINDEDVIMVIKDETNG